MTENEKWNAVISNNSQVDGLFYYAVKSTGIFCRPCCKSKIPIRENTVFFDCREDAIAAGFRPCKRCRPDLVDYQPIADVAAQAKLILEQHHSQRQRLACEIQKIGVSKRRIGQIFKQQYGVSPTEYANNLKIQIAKQQLLESALPILEIAYSLGFESLSAFFAFFRKNTGVTPGEYRKCKDKPSRFADTFYGTYDTALGQVTIACSDCAVASVQFGSRIPDGVKERRTELMDQTASELQEYFSGKRRYFDVPLSQPGTTFQMRVWEAVGKIPYGETRTYQQIAAAIGHPNANRAVGMANNKNLILLLIPCHRVIGANGALMGYAGGIAVKEKLLELERNNKS